MSPEVLHPLCVRGEVERRGIGALARDPADVGIRQVAAADVDVVLVLEPVLQHFELQHADRADDDLLHAAVRLVEDLDGALLRDHPVSMLFCWLRPAPPVCPLPSHPARRNSSKYHKRCRLRRSVPP